MGCTAVLGTLHFSTIKGNERFYRSILMPVAMRVLDPERSHTFAVWLASKGLVPVDRTGDPEILVNRNWFSISSPLEIYQPSCYQGLFLFLPRPCSKMGWKKRDPGYTRQWKISRGWAEKDWVPALKNNRHSFESKFSLSLSPPLRTRLVRATPFWTKKGYVLS